MTIKTNYPNIFSPMNIGAVTIKNRIIMSPMGTALHNMTGDPSVNTIAYYRERAKGGTGLIIMGVVQPIPKKFFGALSTLRVDSQQVIPMLRRLANEVHLYGTKIFAQLHHGGNQAPYINENGNLECVSSSDVVNKVIGFPPRSLSNDEVKEYIQKYIEGAKIVKLANFDGVQLHGGHGYLIQNFLSSRTNLRDDEYGGSLENRCRFATDIIKGIKEACGQDFPVTIRLSVDEFLEDGYALDEGCKIAQLMEAAGADAINCSFGSYESYPATVEPMGFEEGWRVYMAEAVKKAVNVPVVTVGNLRHPEFCEKILAEGKADFIAMGRGLLAEPEWCHKVLHGREDVIRYCISCMTCLNNVLGNSFVCCAINPRTGNEANLPPLVKDGNGRKIVVVGSGPAGLEASHVLAKRGFKVVLMEKDSEIGGQMALAAKPLKREKINWFVQYYKRQMELQGIDIRLNTVATSEKILAEKPYAVFIATGGAPIMPQIPGIEKPSVITAENYLKNNIEIEGKTVAVIGGGLVGCEVSSTVASNGNRVVLVEMLETVGTGQYPDAQIELFNLMDEYNVEVMTNSKMIEVTDEGVVVENALSREKHIIPADVVMLALGVKPVNELYEELFGHVENLCIIGDAQRQGNIIDATRAGHIFALDV